VHDSLIILGAGYRFEKLGRAKWLARCRTHCWDDIDAHGFVMLDQLCRQLAHVEPFLMNRAILSAFKQHRTRNQASHA
jgi:hypothetical protein